MSAMLPEWIADFIAEGTEDAAELEKAALALMACPLVKSIEPLSDGLYATLCSSYTRRRSSYTRRPRCCSGRSNS